MMPGIMEWLNGMAGDGHVDVLTDDAIRHGACALTPENEARVARYLPRDCGVPFSEAEVKGLSHLALVRKWARDSPKQATVVALGRAVAQVIFDDLE